MKKLLVALLFFVALPALSAPLVPGCTAKNALNYNPLATVDDGSCRYDSGGAYLNSLPKVQDYQRAVIVAKDVSIQVLMSKFAQVRLEIGTLLNKPTVFATSEGSYTAPIVTVNLPLGTYWVTPVMKYMFNEYRGMPFQIEVK